MSTFLQMCRRMIPSNDIWKDWPYQWYGFFTHEGRVEGGEYRFVDLPRVVNLIDREWEYPELERLRRYLDGNLYAVAPVSPSGSKCLLCDHMHPVERVHWDGAWLWPGSLGHYVGTHSVRLPDRFTRHIESLCFAPPAEVVFTPLQALPWPEIGRPPGFSERLRSLFARKGVYQTRKAVSP